VINSLSSSGLIEINPIDRIWIVEYQPGEFERHAVLAVVPFRFPSVLFEFVVAHLILVCRTASKSQADRLDFNISLAAWLTNVTGRSSTAG
jgi:hypothetical protein